MLSKLSGTDIVAIVLIVCTCGLIALGHNSIVEFILAGVASAYGFGKITASKLRKK